MFYYKLTYSGDTQQKYSIWGYSHATWEKTPTES